MKFSCSYVSIVILDNKHYGTEVSIKNYFHSDLTYNTYRYEDHEQELVYPLLAGASRPPQPRAYWPVVDSIYEHTLFLFADSLKVALNK